MIRPLPLSLCPSGWVPAMMHALGLLYGALAAESAVEDDALPAEDLDLLTTFIDALARVVEREVVCEAARFEYARYPERYDQDPARCRNILAASPGEQSAAIRRMQLESLDRQEAWLRDHLDPVQP